LDLIIKIGFGIAVGIMLLTALLVLVSL